MKGALIGKGRTAEIYAWGEDQALKLYHQGISLPGVELEATAGRLIFEAGLPSPKVEGTVEVEGQPGIIFERVSGPTMLALFSRQPWLIFRSARQFAELQAAVHSHESGELPDQREKIKRRFERIPQFSAETRQKLLALLDSLPGGTTICHGDFHPDNILISPRGPVVIDWMDATRGNRLYDAARTSYLLSRAALPPGTGLARRLLINLFRKTFHFLYLRRYRQLKPFSNQEFARWGIIVAAARLTEGIAEEEAQLLAIVNQI